MDHIKSDSKIFGYGNDVHAIHTYIHTKVSIINHSNHPTLENVQKDIYTVWGFSTETFSTPLPFKQSVEIL